ncbi:MAG TPA: Hsp20/alpha crystallin family protein, partial [Candidatus Acidoferrales bacterium]|nr:Hsp20/alpha crystallin family protein [Candidatus Acidoferrales bacterium]
MRQDDIAADFDRIYQELSRRTRHGRFEPNADLYLSDDGSTLIVTVEVAGADPSELRVGLEERHLIILGVRYDRERSSRGSVLMKEIEYGQFLKRIHLPVAVTYEDASASYRDG